MRILSIETSCDETAVSIVEANGDFPQAEYKILGNALFSQVDIHREYGGVFPNVAKREHAKTLIPMLRQALLEAKLQEAPASALSRSQTEMLYELLHREEGLAEVLIAFLEENGRPNIQAIAVTHGPGLEPALWVGVNFARALASIWNVPVIPVNHMEGHVLSSIFDGERLPQVVFPALALLISGGHTELILMQNWACYELIGQTRDDAVGEAFDKVARMLGLPYPGGPEISKLAEHARTRGIPQFTKLPRPMLDSGDHDFSFSGLKTAVRYAVQNKDLTSEEKASVAREFEDAATEVLLKKTQHAVDAHGVASVIIGGGVSANRHIRDMFASYFKKEYPELTLYLPDPKLSTDNSVMIALAGHARLGSMLEPKETDTIKADGNLSLEKTN